MKQFLGGIAFALGCLLFGKSMYELGRHDEQLDNKEVQSEDEE